jgi:hypothetical protein
VIISHLSITLSVRVHPLTDFLLGKRKSGGTHSGRIWRGARYYITGKGNEVGRGLGKCSARNL